MVKQIEDEVARDGSVKKYTNKIVGITYHSYYQYPCFSIMLSDSVYVYVKCCYTLILTLYMHVGHPSVSVVISIPACVPYAYC